MNKRARRGNRRDAPGAGKTGEALVRDDAALMSIFSHLDSQSLVSVQQSCKLFNSVRRNNEIWRCVAVCDLSLIGGSFPSRPSN